MRAQQLLFIFLYLLTPLGEPRDVSRWCERHNIISQPTHKRVSRWEYTGTHNRNGWAATRSAERNSSKLYAIYNIKLHMHRLDAKTQRTYARAKAHMAYTRYVSRHSAVAGARARACRLSSAQKVHVCTSAHLLLHKYTR